MYTVLEKMCLFGGLKYCPQLKKKKKKKKLSTKHVSNDLHWMIKIKLRKVVDQWLNAIQREKYCQAHEFYNVLMLYMA